MRLSIVLSLCAFAGQVVAGSGSTETNGQSHNVSFVNKHNYYFDVNGNVVNSVNGKVDWIDEQYFWIVNASRGLPEICEDWYTDLLSELFFQGSGELVSQSY